MTSDDVLAPHCLARLIHILRMHEEAFRTSARHCSMGVACARRSAAGREPAAERAAPDGQWDEKGNALWNGLWNGLWYGLWLPVQARGCSSRRVMESDDRCAWRRTGRMESPPPQ